jgi:hypothetical protein
VAKISSDTNLVAVTCNGSDTVLGGSVLNIQFQYSAADLQSNGAGWDVV